MPRRKVIIADWLCLIYPIVDAHWWPPNLKISSQYKVLSTSEPTGGSRDLDDTTIQVGGAILGGDLRSQGDAIIHGFEKELVKMRKEIVLEAEDLMLSICEAALDKRRVKLRDRHRLATSVDEDEDDVV